jgi:hypothetical protein
MDAARLFLFVPIPIYKFSLVEIHTFKLFNCMGYTVIYPYANMEIKESRHYITAVLLANRMDSILIINILKHPLYWL